MDRPTRNLVLGIATDYGLPEIQPFATSFKASGVDARACLFTARLDPLAKRFLGRMGVELYACEYPGGDMPNMVVTARFLLFRKFLEERRGQFDRVLITDVRDVAFQDDPFAWDLGQGLCLFLEDPGVTMAQSPLNADWLVRAYGRAMLERLGDFAISCVGTTLGDADAVLQYLQIMTREMAGLPDFFGTDQAAHNVLARTGRLPGSRLFENDHGPVMTLGLKPAAGIRVDRQGRVVNDDNRVVPVLHQYDRHPLLDALVRKRFGSP